LLHRQGVKSFKSNFSDEHNVIPDLSLLSRPLHLLLLLAPSGNARYNSCVTTPVSQSSCLKVLFFGRLKDLIGQAEDSVNSADAATIEHLFALYSARIPELAKYRSSVVATRNQEFAAWDTPLCPGDEVAFLPPVSGG